jgi:DNA polymerase III delta prime subunit
MPRVVTKSVLDHHDAAIDEIIASCNGDMRGAVKALMLVNEQLESELRQLYGAANGSRTEYRAENLLH